MEMELVYGQGRLGRELQMVLRNVYVCVVKIGAVEEFFCPTLVSFFLSVCMQE